MEYSPGSSPFCKQPVTVVFPPADFSCADALGVTYAPTANTNSSNADNRTSFCMFNLLIDEWGAISDSWVPAELPQCQPTGHRPQPCLRVNNKLPLKCKIVILEVSPK